MKSVAIIGANGYVGSYLTKALAAHYRVTALLRSRDSLCRPAHGVQYQTIAEPLQHFDIIINTSYALHKHKKICAMQNDDMIQLLQRISHEQTFIVHLSSLAVFGFGLDLEVRAEAVPTRNDYAYVYSKTDMENKLLATFGSERLAIIRLGNVWGPGNTSYTQPVIDSLLWGLPLMPEQPGMSNLTHIHNIVSYIKHLLSSNQHLTFHHLAEWSHMNWQQVIEEMAEILGATPCVLQQQPYYSRTISEELDHAFSKSIIEAIKTLRNGRFTAAYFPEEIITALLKQLAPLKKPKEPPQSGAVAIPETFIWVLNCKQSFTNAWVTGWIPPLKWSDALPELKEWMKQSGYIIS